MSTRAVVHLTSVHTPFDVRIFHKECKTLAQAGYDVTLIAPDGEDRVCDGVRIHAITRSATRLNRMTQTLWQIYRAAIKLNAHVYHFHDPELILVALLLKLHGKRVIYDVHEDVPRDILSKGYIPGPLRGVIAKVAQLTEYFAGAFCNGVVAATPVIASRFPIKKTVTVHNFPIYGEFESANRATYDQRPPLCVYIGGLSEKRGAEETVRALSAVAPEYGSRLALAGTFSPPSYEDHLKNVPGWERVDWLGWLNRKQVSLLLARARIGLVLLQPTPAYRDAYPIKLFEYMMAGVPVIASDFPLWREIVSQAGCGLLVDPTRPDKIASAIQWLLDHPSEAGEMGQKGAEAVRQRFTWEREAEKLCALYARLLQ